MTHFSVNYISNSDWTSQFVRTLSQKKSEQSPSKVQAESARIRGGECKDLIMEDHEIEGSQRILGSEGQRIMGDHG